MWGHCAEKASIWWATVVALFSTAFIKCVCQGIYPSIYRTFIRYQISHQPSFVLVLFSLPLTEFPDPRNPNFSNLLRSEVPTPFFLPFFIEKVSSRSSIGFVSCSISILFVFFLFLFLSEFHATVIGSVVFCQCFSFVIVSLSI